jgi:nucleotide-binding universal stress UspA family protein
MPDAEIRRIKRVLVASGLSLESVGAIRLAIQCAKRFGAELHAIHVIEPLTGAAKEAMPEVVEAAPKHAREAFSRFAAEHGLTEAGATLHVVEGKGEHEILNAVKQFDIDLVVVGRYGKGGMKKGRLGSLAGRIARTSPVTVLVADPAATEAPARIAVATGFSEECDILMKRGAHLAKAFGTDSVHLLHAYELPLGYSHVMSEEQAEAKLRTVAERRTAYVQEHYANALGVNLKLHAARGDARSVVPALATEHNIDVLVVGTHSRSPAAMFMLPRTTEAIINNVHCAVWATKRPEWYEGFYQAVKHMMGM